MFSIQAMGVAQKMGRALKVQFLLIGKQGQSNFKKINQFVTNDFSGDNRQTEWSCKTLEVGWRFKTNLPDSQKEGFDPVILLFT